MSGVGNYAGGHAYKLCARYAYEKYAANSLPRVAGLGARGVCDVDEVSLMAPGKCYRPAHPTSRRERVNWWKRIMREARARFGGFQSEGAGTGLCRNSTGPTVSPPPPMLRAP